MNSKVTIIVPIYNVENYLSRCIESIINQSYRNLEIFLINDGSTDNSGKIAEEYAAHDSRIKVIHKENGGLSDARNVGIEKSTGEYITFLDSDDFFATNFVLKLMSIIKARELDVVVCKNNIFTENETLQLEKTNDNNGLCILNNIEASKVILYQKKYDVSAWGKIYKRDLFDTLRFPKGLNFEDIPTIYKAFMNANMIGFTNEKLYNYQVRANSIENEPFNFKKLDGIKTGQIMLDEITNNYPELVKAAQSRFIAINFHILYQIDRPIKECDVIKKNIKLYRTNVLFDRESKLKVKIACILSFFSFDITLKMLRKLKK